MVEISSGFKYTNARGQEVKVEAVMGEWARVAVRQGVRRFARSLKKVTEIQSEIAKAEAHKEFEEARAKTATIDAEVWAGKRDGGIAAPDASIIPPFPSSPSMTLKIGRVPYAVRDLVDASRVYQIERDKSGKGASEFPVGRVGEYLISYNGRVWAKGDGQNKKVILEATRLECVNCGQQYTRATPCFDHCRYCIPDAIAATIHTEADLRAFQRAQGADVPEPQMLICAWCKFVLREGTTPASHGICGTCAPIVHAEAEGK